MLERILIIDAADDVEQLIRFCAHPYWPEVVLETYDPGSGIPEPTFDWFRYDLLLLDYDLGLPGANGLDWLRQLKENPYLPPTILLTGYASDRLKEEAEKLGADGFLEKDNLSPHAFARMVKKIIMDTENREDTDHSERESDGMTEFLSPQERHEILASLLQSDTYGQQDDYDKTRLMNYEDMVSVLHREKKKVTTDGELPATPKPAATGGVSRTTATSSQRTTAPNSRTRLRAGNQPIVIPGYFVQKKIGEGGMATIYLAEREEDQLLVVLKVLKFDGKGDSNLLRRFMREYKLIAQLNHPNIVQIFERAFASNFAYIAMEYFPCGDLAERLRKGVDTKRALSYLKQIAEGLGAAHAQGIVHRDMKPANILFRTQDNLAITDFGIAKLVVEDQVKKELTMDGSLMGTLYYISPEQIEGAEADMRSDIYSLGVIMYQMLTGKHPFSGKTPNEVFEGHLYGPIPKLTGRFVSLQPLLDGLLAKDPDERFQSTDELVMGIDWDEY